MILKKCSPAQQTPTSTNAPGENNSPLSNTLNLFEIIISTIEPSSYIFNVVFIKILILIHKAKVYRIIALLRQHSPV